MSRENAGVQGPTWGDIHDYIEALEAKWNVHIVVRTKFWETGRPARRSAQVVADATEEAKVGAKVRCMGYAAFRGNAGAATMPGAFYAALVELEGKLEGIETVAQAKMAF